MKNDITEFYPFENYATFDRVRKLKWNNNATLQAISYFNTVHGKKITRNNLIEGLASGAVEYIIAALYGALCAADKRITLPIFNRIYKPEYLSEYIKAVYEGAKANEPEPVIKDTGADLDPDWPDTQSEAKKNKELNKTTSAIGSGSQKAKSASRSTKSKKPHTEG